MTVFFSKKDKKTICEDCIFYEKEIKNCKIKYTRYQINLKKCPLYKKITYINDKDTELMLLLNVMEKAKEIKCIHKTFEQDIVIDSMAYFNLISAMMAYQSHQSK